MGSTVKVQLAWVPGTNTTAFHVEESLDNGKTWQTLANNITGTSMLLPTPPVGTAPLFRIQALDGPAPSTQPTLNQLTASRSSAWVMASRYANTSGITPQCIGLQAFGTMIFANGKSETTLTPILYSNTNYS